ncbi:MAG: hypothetical protein HQK84_05925, partial [Nitrospinae bacterium]|nr:hypothetical protein [Nitrospinota bacterium]
EAYLLSRELIKEQKLDIKIAYVEFNFNATKATFFFTSEARADYRNLVRELAKQLKTKIEMKQIGVRELAKMTGGCGVCGETLCCSTFLNSFSPISIKMAKVQDLSLNPAKISGYCGRLMCCLEYEYEVYKDIRQNFPKQGARFHCDRGNCCVVKNELLMDSVTIYEEDNQRTDQITAEDVAKYFKPGVNHMMPRTQADPINRDRNNRNNTSEEQKSEERIERMKQRPKLVKQFKSIDEIDLESDDSALYKNTSAEKKEKRYEKPFSPKQGGEKQDAKPTGEHEGGKKKKPFNKKFNPKWKKKNKNKNVDDRPKPPSTPTPTS